MKRQSKPLTTPAGKRKIKRKISKEVRAARAANMKKVRQTKEHNITVTLLTTHFVNGVVFGPGQITLKQSVAQQFLNEEENLLRQERELFGTKATIVGRQGPTGFYSTRQVAPETFNESWVSAEEATTTR